MSTAPNHMIIFLTMEYLRAEQARCAKTESELDARIYRDMSRIIAEPRSEYNMKYDRVLDMAADLAQWREYRIELGALRWSLDQI